MAKGSRGRRDVPTSSLTSLSRLVSPSYMLASPLNVLEDRRTFHPEAAYRPPLSFPNDAAQVIVGDRKPSPRQIRRGFRVRSQTKGVLTFASPSRVVICVRRKIRKEVLHAIKKTGRGRGRRSPRFNPYSHIRC